MSPTYNIIKFSDLILSVEKSQSLTTDLPNERRSDAPGRRSQRRRFRNLNAEREREKTRELTYIYKQALEDTQVNSPQKSSQPGLRSIIQNGLQGKKIVGKRTTSEKESDSEKQEGNDITSCLVGQLAREATMNVESMASNEPRRRRRTRQNNTLNNSRKSKDNFNISDLIKEHNN